MACRDEKLSDGKVGRKIENIQDRIPIGQETLFVGDSILPCDDCREGTLLVLRAPFKVLPASAKKNQAGARFCAVAWRHCTG